MRSGIIRRMDDLGRITVPKEIRRVLHIKENDPFEISVFGKSIMLEKYNPPETLGVIATPILKVLSKDYNAKVAVCGENKVLQCFGFPMLVSRMVSDNMRFHMESGIEFIAKNDEKGLYLYEDDKTYLVSVVIPINYGTDSKGSVVLLNESGNEISSDLIAQMRFTAKLLEYQAKDWL